ncbi:hypothetical protein vseg_019940 [Gypsophila vaccaria]
MDRLPESVIVELLSFLSIKSLCRLKIVCKSWHAIIKSPYLVYKQLNRNKYSHAECLLAVFCYPTSRTQFAHRMLHLDGPNRHDRDSGGFSSTEPPTQYKICGSCNGIYYMRCGMRHSAIHINYLWNPSLREKKYLPPMIMKPDLPPNIKYDKEHYGFGFDPVTGDYKVVIIEAYESEDYPASIMIYSLISHSWKYVGDLSKFYYLRDNTCHAFADSSFYWLGSQESNAYKYQVIISFDLATEVSKIIELPELRTTDFISHESYSESLMVYRNSIALATLHQRVYFDIWTLKGTCWTMELNVKLGNYWVDKPLDRSFVINNFVFFEGPEALVVCDPCSGEARRLPIPSAQDHICKTMWVRMESLVPLNDENFWKPYKHRIRRAKVSPSTY